MNFNHHKLTGDLRKGTIFTLASLLVLLMAMPTPVKSQCAYGYKAYQVAGNAISVEHNRGVSSYSNILGAADGSHARFYDANDSIQIKLDNTVNSGFPYAITWKMRTSETGTAEMEIFESIEGVTWFKHSATFTTSNTSSYDSTIIVADASARYIRIVNRSGVGFDVDAISYDLDTCIVNNNPPNKINGWVFQDTDKDNAISPGDVAMANIKVKLYKDVNTNNIVDGADVLLDSSQSSIAGNYSFNVPSLATTVIYEILTAEDDAEEDLPSGSPSTSGTDLDFGYQLPGKPYMVGMRFSNVDLPQGATVNQAFVKFVASSNHSDSVSLRIFGENAGNATTFNTSSRRVSGLTRTDSVDWIDVEPWEVNNFYSSPDISTIINQIIGRSDWVSGNSINIMIHGGPNKREAFSFDAASLTPPLLIIDTVGDLADYYMVSIDMKDIPSGYSAGTSEFPIQFDWCDQQDTLGNFPMQAWVLPIALTEFAGTLSNNGINLNWETTSEQNCDYYEIQRCTSADGNFLTIGSHEAMGTTMDQQNYRFTDHDFDRSAKVIYYRLKQVDFNGEFTISEAISVSLPEMISQLGQVSFYPNPARDHLTINLTQEWKGKLDCYDLTGQKHFSLDFQGGQVLQLAEYDLAGGTYIFRLTNDSGSRDQKIVIQ